MADNKKKDKSKNPLLNGIEALTNITRSSSSRTYGVSRDINDILGNDVNDYISKLNADSDEDKSLINSHVSKSKIKQQQFQLKNTSNELYKIITDEKMMESVASITNLKGAQFSQILKDYEMIKRCIPQVHRVINTLKNNIISPDAMTQSAIGIKYPANIDKAMQDKIDNIIDKYKLNTKLQNWIIEYLIASLKYVTVVPYSTIPDMLSADKPLSECIDELSNEKLSTTLAEASGLVNKSDFKSMNESFSLDISKMCSVAYEDNSNGIDISLLNELKSTSINVGEVINEALENIEFINGGINYFKKSILNEAVAIKNNDPNKSMKSVLKKLNNSSSTVSYNKVYVPEGLVDDKTVKNIRNKVDFHGAHIEELPTEKVLTFKLRDTIIGYLYVEDSAPAQKKNNMSSILDKINSSVYMKYNTENPADRIESTIVKAIGDKLIKAIDANFINDCYDDMEIIYEFVRANELYVKNKKVVFFHPDDVCEFRRQDGSIMKNCMFLAKLYILTLLSNVITNVTRGADRNFHYVKTGVTTDIEGHVNDSIRAIKQSQVRYSDIGTINEIFNIVGSAVDVFMPISIDGEKPIETETVSGQNVDMNNDFLNALLRSIIQSFGVPASVIDDFESVDFAKTLAMNNIDMAKAILDAQMEITEPLTKLVRLLITYEFPDFDNVEDLFAVLNPPIVIVTEMNKERIDSISSMADVLSALLLPQVNESPEDRNIRLFKKEYVKANMPSIDWNSVDEILKKIKRNSKEIEHEEEIYQLNDSQEQEDEGSEYQQEDNDINQDNNDYSY